MNVIVIGGPIASGKSTLGRAVAARLQERGNQAAVLDLDLIYEMLDPLRRPKTKEAVWSAARRAAGRMAAGLLLESRSVVVEGDFAGDQALRELVGELPDSAFVHLVLLEVSCATAAKRASADPTRGISRDEAFLAAHYQEFEAGWEGRSVLHLNTDRLDIDESTNAVLALLTP